MATTLEMVSDLIRDRLAEIGMPVNDWDLGEKARRERGLPLRVAWVHAGGTMQPVDGAGRRIIDLGTKRVAIRLLHTDAMDVRCHLWAPDEERYELLRARVLSAVRDVLGPQSEAGRYVIETEAERSGKVHGSLTKGVQAFTWRVPVARLESASTDQLGPGLPTRPLVRVDGQVFTFEFDHTL